MIRLSAFSPIIPQIQVTLGCNFHCDYCFQSHEDGIIDLSAVEMILEKTVAHHRLGCHQTPVVVIWHGGEPLLAGLRFFEAVVDIESRFPGICFHNRVQTNGSLMSEAFCRFFVEHDFHVGFSLDGPEEIHNCHRRFKASDQGTFHSVIRGIQCYRRFADTSRIPVIAVVTQESIGREKDIFNFFKALRANVQLDIYDLRHIDFSGYDHRPVNRSNNWQRPELAPSSDEIGGFLIRLFDLWFHDSTGQADFNELRNDVRMILQPDVDLGNPIHKKRCDAGRVIFDPLGRAFSCDQYINDDATSLGNIMTHSMEDILSRKGRRWEQIKTRIRSAGEPMACNACEWGRRHMGGCLTCMKYNALLLDAREKELPDDQWYKAELPESLKALSGETYYCEGLRTFWDHARHVIEHELAKNG